jgi:hypothetical protein
MLYPVKPCGAAFMWLRCGKLAFIAFIVTALTSDIGFLSVLSVLSGKNIAFIKTVV